MSRVRVYELAKEAGMASKVLADKLIEMGYDIKGHSSTVDEETAADIRASVLQSSDSELVEKRIDAEQTGGTTVIRRRATTIIRRPKKTDEEDLDLDETPEKIQKLEEDELQGVEESHDQQQIESEAVQANESQPAPVVEEKTEPKLSAPTVEELIAQQPAIEAEKMRLAKKAKEEEAALKEKENLETRAAVDKKYKKGVAKVIGTIELPQEDSGAVPRKKPVRPQIKKAATQFQPDQPSTDASGQARVKKKGKRSEVFPEDDSKDERGFRKKKGRKIVKVTKFGFDGDRIGGKRGKKKKGKGKNLAQQPAVEMKASKKKIKIYETISVGDLAHRMGIKASEIISKLMDLGVMATVNQALDVDTATLVASDFSYEVEQAFTEEIGVQQLAAKEEGGELMPRSPVITVMGHVDHGKTSILDAIRKTDVAEGEAGGITQHIGAYHVKSAAGDVTFVDTPGHAAFTEMRSRGAQITDLVILVVAADDGVMNQTREAIQHAKAANVPILVAINKIDKENADPDRVKRELADLDLAPEEWGGSTIFCEMSAKQNKGINNLLENIELMAEILELKADPKRKAVGRVVEAKLDKGRGPVATVLVQEGTLRTGDHFVVGHFSGKVRALLDYRGKPIKSAGPSIPVEVHGLSGVPSAGDEFVVVTDEKMAKSVSQARTMKVRENELAAGSKVSLDSLFDKLSEGNVQELRIVLRADVQGTLEAFGKAAEKLSTDEVKVKILSEGTGTMTDSDVLLASASDAVIIGFNVRPSGKVKELAAKEGVDMRSYDVIYHALDDIKDAMVGMLAPTFEEDVIGNAEVRDTFHAPKVGTIAGCSVTEGKILRNSSVRVVRDGVVVYVGKIESLRRFKDDVKEVLAGYECGVSVEKYNDIKVGDNLEAFVMKEVAAKLGATQQEKDDDGDSK